MEGGDASAVEQKMIFVCGCGHSGTSLITAMLGAHPQIYAIPEETGWFARLKLSDTEVIRAVTERYVPDAKKKKAAYICEKTPTHLHHMARIQAIFPTASIVIPVRDPRDVALSIKLRTEDLKAGYERWLRDNAVVRDALVTGKAVFTFKYEDLIENPQHMLSRVCTHIGITYSASMLNYHHDTRSWFGSKTAPTSDVPDAKDHVELRNWQIKQPIMERRGRWKSLLSQDEIVEVEAACSDLMMYFGYRPTAPS